jgi:hypothetical protein
VVYPALEGVGGLLVIIAGNRGHSQMKGNESPSKIPFAISALASIISLQWGEERRGGEGRGGESGRGGEGRGEESRRHGEMMRGTCPKHTAGTYRTTTVKSPCVINVC